MNRPISRRHLIAGGAGAAGAAAMLPAGGRLAASSHLPPLTGELVILRQPIRIFDSRDPASFFARKFVDGDEVAINVGAAAGGEFVTAVFANVTVTQTEGAGFLTVRPEFLGDDSEDDSPPPVTTSNINWTSDDISLANMTLSPTGGENSIEVICTGVGAATHVIVDVQGYVPFAPTEI
jgi:hypothetical protein